MQMPAFPLYLFVRGPAYAIGLV